MHSLHTLLVSWKSTHNVLSYSIHKQTNERTNGSENSTPPRPTATQTGRNKVYLILITRSTDRSRDRRNQGWKVEGDLKWGWITHPLPFPPPSLSHLPLLPPPLFHTFHSLLLFSLPRRIQLEGVWRNLLGCPRCPKTSQLEGTKYTWSHDTIRYDTRCYINVRSKANMSQLNLPHGHDLYSWRERVPWGP